eukprot:scaffold10297_cov113-Isochrysis_galbana.AAC.22
MPANEHGQNPIGQTSQPFSLEIVHPSHAWGLREWDGAPVTVDKGAFPTGRAHSPELNLTFLTSPLPR